MIDTIHVICSGVHMYTTTSPPRQWITNVNIPLPNKGAISLMTDYNAIAAKVYNKILLNRIRPHVDPLLRSCKESWKASRFTNSH